MSNFIDPSLPVEASADAASLPPSEATRPTETADTPTETPAASPVGTPPVMPPKPEPPMPWPIVVRRFTGAPIEAYTKLNADFGLTLTPKSYTRLQKLFREVLRRDPTVGELCLLDALDDSDHRSPRRVGVGELYTDSAAIAETWADMMAKHSELYAANGVYRKLCDMQHQS